MRAITGPTCRITRRCTAGCDNASRSKSSGSINATRHAVSASIRTPSGPRVSTAIAADHVGACWRPTGSVRSPSRSTVCTSPSSSSNTPRGLLALFDEHVSRRGVERRATAAHCASCVVVEVVEQVDRPQVGHGERRVAHPSTRYWWTSETAIEPSPTALATRLIDRARTSPATNTPGTLVSSR